VTIVDAGEAVHGIGTVLVAEHEVPVELRWSSARNLVVRYYKAGKVITHSRAADVAVTFEPSPPAPMPHTSSETPPAT
jgi:hypothetical protein